MELLFPSSSRVIPFVLLILPYCQAWGAQTLPRVRVEESRFIDAHGRERHFRGTNVVVKDPPWGPWLVETFDSNLSFVEADVELLASWGVNLIRLGVMWPGVIPEARGQVNHTYLAKIREIVRMASKGSIYVLANMHQDQWAKPLCGEGMPDWWFNEFSSASTFPAPIDESFGKGDRTFAQCSTLPQFSEIWTYDLSKTIQALYDHGAPDVADYFTEMAAALGDESNLLAADLFNEPFPGDVYSDHKWRNNTYANRNNLQPFYEDVTARVRTQVPQQSRFRFAYEPAWPVGDQHWDSKSVVPISSGFSSLPEKDSVISFHWYTPPAESNLALFLDGHKADAQRLSAAPLLSEYWFAPGSWSFESVLPIVQTIESKLVSHTEWTYKGFSANLPNGTCNGCGSSFFWNNGSLGLGVTKAFARPLAGAVAGRTVSMQFHANNISFDLEYSLINTNWAPTVIVWPGYWLPEASCSSLTVKVDGDDHASVSKDLTSGRVLVEGVRIEAYCSISVYHAKDAALGTHVKIHVGARAGKTLRLFSRNGGKRTHMQRLLDISGTYVVFPAVAVLSVVLLSVVAKSTSLLSRSARTEEARVELFLE